jgi:hypothetical protein
LRPKSGEAGKPCKHSSKTNRDCRQKTQMTLQNHATQRFPRSKNNKFFSSFCSQKEVIVFINRKPPVRTVLLGNGMIVLLRS